MFFIVCMLTFFFSSCDEVDCNSVVVIRGFTLLMHLSERVKETMFRGARKRGCSNNAMPTVQLNWNVEPKNGKDVFFSRETYDKYNLSPSLLELWRLANRRSKVTEKASGKEVTEKTSAKGIAAELAGKDNTEKVSGREINEKTLLKGVNEKARWNASRLSSQSSAAEGGDDEEQQPLLAKSTIVPLPQPPLAYPFFSSLSAADQKKYVQLLAIYSGKNGKGDFNQGPQRQAYTQYLELKSFLQNEIADYLKFMHNVAKKRAEDYDHITKDALRYTEELLNASLAQVKRYPELYSLCEMTSLMGGKVCTDLTFKMEKQVLALGKTHFFKPCFPFIPSTLPLPVGYETVAKSLPAEQCAAAHHKDISTDPNAEKLALKYHPQVALSAQSLYTLMNNHGINYKEQWELPVCVKVIQGKDTPPRCIVYIDPPLPKKQLSVRERNQMFHEVPFDFLMSRKSSADINAVALNQQEKKDVPKVVQPSETELEFECDVTELETFGVSSNPVKAFKKPSSPSKPQSLPAAYPNKLQRGKKFGSEENIEAQKLDPAKPDLGIPEIRNLHDQSNRAHAVSIYESLFCDSDDSQSFKGFASDELEELVESEPDTDISDCLESSYESPIKKTRLCAKNLKKKKCENVARSTSYTSDTDEERLVINIGDLNNEKVRYTSRDSFPTGEQPERSTKEKYKKSSPRKPVKKLSKDLDPVGKILKMQSELMKVNPKKAVEQTFGSPDKSSPAGNREKPSLAPARTHCPGNATNTVPAPLLVETQLLPDELQITVEDTAVYTAPQSGNLVYKLFSLDGMLLLVRCTVQKAKTKSKRFAKSATPHFPIFLLPKLEYQAHYGVEALTESEVCRLWLETLLHSYFSFYICHIDAFSSTLFMLEEVNADAIKEKFGNFKPSDSLNILRHILKKVTSLQEGSYLLSHAAGDSSVTIYQNIKDEVTRSTYNLHRAHSYLPRVPTTLSVPWVPLDPNTLLPYHISMGRVPCTFPPGPEGPADKHRGGVHRKTLFTEGNGSREPATGTTGWSPKKNKKNKGKYF